MAYSIQQVTSDGTLTSIAVSFEFKDRSTIKVFVGGFPVTTGWQWASPTINTIIFDNPIPNGVEVIVRRISDLSTVDHIFGYRADGSGNAAFDANSMDDNFEQTMWAAQEVQDGNDLTQTSAETAREQARIATEAAQAAAASEVAAGLSEAAADASADAAAASEAAVAGAEAATAASAVAALASQNAAAASASAAATSESQAEAAAVATAADAAATEADATAAALSQTAAAASAAAAADSETAAASSEASASASAVDANASEQLAKDWAIKMDGPVDGAEFSAKHYAEVTATKAGIPVYFEVPTTDVGPIYVVDIGLMEWNLEVGGYVAESGGATGGGADKIFYKNDQTVTKNYTIEATENAVTAGPIVIEADVIVEGNWVVL